MACVRSARSVSTTLGLPLLTVCVLSQSTLLRLKVALWGTVCGRPWVACTAQVKPLRFRFSGSPQRRRLGWSCILCPLPRSKQFRWPGAWRVQSSLAVSYHLLQPSHSVSWVAAGVPVSGMPCVSSGELIPGCDPPWECQPPRIPRSLGRQMGACLRFCRGCPSGAEIVPFWLWLPPHASLSPASAQPASSLVLSPLFCEWARKCLRLGLFPG